VGKWRFVRVSRSHRSITCRPVMESSTR
jgi:hypothetical protein